MKTIRASKQPSGGTAPTKDTNNNIARPYYIDNDKAALRVFKDHLAQSDYKENPRERTNILLRAYDVY